MGKTIFIIAIFVLIVAVLIVSEYYIGDYSHLFSEASLDQAFLPFLS